MERVNVTLLQRGAAADRRYVSASFSWRNTVFGRMAAAPADNIIVEYRFFFLFLFILLFHSVLLFLLAHDAAMMA